MNNKKKIDTSVWIFRVALILWLLMLLTLCSYSIPHIESPRETQLNGLVSNSDGIFDFEAYIRGL